MKRRGEYVIRMPGSRKTEAQYAEAALEMIGLPVGPPRPPRLPLPNEMRPKLEAVLRTLGVPAARQAA